MMDIKNNLFTKTLFLIIIAEVVSFAGFEFPTISLAGFWLFCVLALVLSLYSVEYGLYLILAELVIGSKGYLFSLELEGMSLSIRIAFFLIVMSVWLVKTGLKLLKSRPKLLFGIFYTKTFKYFFPLGIFITWGLANAFLRKNAFNDIFDDFNAWLFFFLLLPLSAVFIYHNNCNSVTRLINDLKKVFTASLVWLITKTFLLLYIFSHQMEWTMPEIYKWVRVTGVGEITLMNDGFYRIFFQSHIFALLAFVLLLTLFAKNLKDTPFNGKIFRSKKDFWQIYILLTMLLSVTIISFSRSNWVGLIAGLMLLGILMLYNFKIKKTLLFGGHIIIMGLTAVMLITLTVKFPFPNTTGDFSTAGLLTERAGQVSGEAGVSSRWALLPELLNKIKAAPVLGQGFGATLTYKSSDPRVLKSSPTGNYTTYAFEWGWLDIWLKLGFFGLLSYIYFLWGILFGTTNAKLWEINANTALRLSIITLAAVSFFSPYMNHPLGIGFVLFAALTIEFSDHKSQDLQKN